MTCIIEGLRYVALLTDAERPRGYRSRSRSRSHHRYSEEEEDCPPRHRRHHRHGRRARHSRSRSRERAGGSRHRHRRHRHGSRDLDDGGRRRRRRSHSRSSSRSRSQSPKAPPERPAGAKPALRAPGVGIRETGTVLPEAIPASTATNPQQFLVTAMPTTAAPTSTASAALATTTMPPGVSPALAAARAAALALTQASSGSALPSYYNPSAVNPLKYAEQMQKRRLLWKKSAEGDANSSSPEEKPASSCAKVWEKMTFAQDEGGKVTAKFRKLMGIRSEPPPDADPSSDPLLSKQEKLFHDLDQQYEAARLSTHTHRGVGLGYSSQMAAFFQQTNLTK
ncbi:arginine/serine-rich coiled-coil protein, putative [Ixodes scapularis]|uniref:Arginine/serine-rich coiled-coil protein, putative n=1 Tax=Ixodes scapularis TaxID=6945 RepID=B7QMW2_IXOSC|nr:arginine/serine-rich coiled-coil protein, putative [Ixodes scapularis]|eukprot:XP_002400307.1 arginine/serine-rich coiled-coil protein, putative [Ixodes scapularis]